MTELKTGSKKAEALKRQFKSAELYGVDDLYKAYEKPSRNKYIAFLNCKDIYKKLRGCGGLFIYGSNCHQFTAYFKSKKFIYKITKNNLFKTAV